MSDISRFHKIRRVALIVIAFLVLTLFTQIGGFIFVAGYFLIQNVKWVAQRKWFFKWTVFVAFYTFSNLVIIPPLASLGGRVPLPYSSKSSLNPHSWLTVLCNRHYVTEKTKKGLAAAADEWAKSGQKLYYLDANFPFWNGYPLLPHLSHNDGKKVDLCFVYEKNALPARSPAWFGYGYFSEPLPREFNTCEACLSKGYNLYDVNKYLSWFPDKNVRMSEEKTAQLLRILLTQPETEKIFIEPHLKIRLGLGSEQKIRFHGCHAVRHDDHIHWQIY